MGLFNILSYTRTFLGLFLAFLLVPCAATDNFKQAVEAHKRTDFLTAISKFRGLAEKEDKRAQFALGLLYDNREGIAENDKQAAI